MKTILLTLFILFLFIACGQITKSISENSEKTLAQNIPTQKTLQDCGQMNFRFLITDDFQSTPVVRHIEVFLDEKAFSEENLKTLFSRLSKKYSEATFLIIIVNTNWEQISLPLNSDNCPGTGISEQRGKPEMFEYHIAQYYRRGENEFFTYNPTLGTSKFKDVILKGNKIYRNGAWQ